MTPRLLYAPRDAGTTPLHEGSKGGHGDVVRLLLEQGADPEIAGTGGVFKDKTPLEVSPRKKC